MRRNQLFAKRSKCSFATDKVEYLGNFIQEEGVSTDPHKIKAIVEWPIPSKLKALREFIGLDDYYIIFLRSFGTIARSLTALMKKNCFEWSGEAETAFRTLKQALCEAPVLALPQFDKPFVVETDACGQGIRAGLMQEGHPIAYISRHLSKASHFVALSHPYSASSVAPDFLDNVFKLHGFLRSIVSDRDAVFLSDFWKELFSLQGLALNMSSASHPQSDDQMEVVNRCVETYLRCMCSDRPKMWSKWLPLAEYWYNTNFYTAFQTTSFEAVYG